MLGAEASWAQVSIALLLLLISKREVPMAEISTPPAHASISLLHSSTLDIQVYRVTWSLAPHGPGPQTIHLLKRNL